VDYDRRLTELEAKLSGTQRGLAWLKRQQEKGGFTDLVCRGLEPGVYIERIRQGPPSEVIDRFIINDEDSAFVFDCVGECNLEALQLEFCGDEVALRALYLRRLLHGIDIPEESDLQRFRSILKDFTLRGLALAGAIQALSEHHLGGHRVLFTDTEKGLAERNAAARQLCDVFNEIAPSYDAQPITAAELEEAVRLEAVKTEEYLVSLTRSQVDLRFRGGFNTGPWLAPYLDDVRNMRASNDDSMHSAPTASPPTLTTPANFYTPHSIDSRPSPNRPNTSPYHSHSDRS
jgi:hypothetical protein